MITVDNRPFLGISCETCCKAYDVFHSHLWANSCSPAYIGDHGQKFDTGIITKHKKKFVGTLFSTILSNEEVSGGRAQMGVHKQAMAYIAG